MRPVGRSPKSAALMTAVAPLTGPRGALSSMLAGNFVIGMGVLAPAALLNDLVADLSVTPTEVGLLVSYGALILCIGAPLLAYLTAAVPRRALLAGRLCSMELAISLRLLRRTLGRFWPFGS
jgi:predicted MFS family arabinose efflux permease